MQKTIQVSEELVNDVQSKDIEAQVSKEVILQALDAHKLDSDTSFIESPIFKAYEKESAQKRMAWERAKNDMFEKSAPADVKAKAKSWSLNYFTGELTIEM